MYHGDTNERQRSELHMVRKEVVPNVLLLPLQHLWVIYDTHYVVYQFIVWLSWCVDFNTVDLFLTFGQSASAMFARWKVVHYLWQRLLKLK